MLNRADLETLKQELATIREGYEAGIKAGIDPLSEQMQVLQNALKELEGRFQNLEASRQAASDSRAVVQDGPYRGMDIVELSMAKALAGVAGDDGGPAPWLANVQQALDNVSAGKGAELTGEDTVGILWNDVNLRTLVAPLPMRVPMTSDPMKVPLQVGDLQFYPRGADEAAIATDTATGERQLNAHELVAEVDWSYSLEEDAVVAMMPTFRESVIRNVAEVEDDVLVNADSTLTNANINSNGAAVTKETDGVAQYTLGFDGLRHYPLVAFNEQSTNINAALTDVNFRTIRAKMGKYGVQPSQLAIVVGPETYFSMMGLPSVLTLDKFGSQATVLTGQLGSIDGIPIIVSEFMKLANNAGMVASAANQNTKGSLLMFNRTQWALGYRREPLIEVWRDVRKRQVVMVVSLRLALQHRGQFPHTTIGYNITV